MQRRPLAFVPMGLGVSVPSKELTAILASFAEFGTSQHCRDVNALETEAISLETHPPYHTCRLLSGRRSRLLGGFPRAAA